MFDPGGCSIGAKRPGNNLIVALMVVLSLALVFSPFGMAQPIDQRKADAQKDVEQLQQRVESAVERYKSACGRLEATRGLIHENQAQLDQAREELAARQSTLNKRVRAMYVTRSNRFIEVAVGADDFDEFLVGLDLVKKVGQKDASLVRSVKDAKARLESREKALAERKGEQEAAAREMAESKATVESELQQSKGKLAAVEEEIRQAMARRAAETAASGSRSGSRVASRVPYPFTRRAVPPGTPHPGVVDVAYNQLGKPYVWGAEGPDSFDCSGLTSYCYRVGAGMEITRSSYDQATCGAQVSVSELQPGDILGFRSWGHVGLYIGGNEFIHAPHTGDVVRIASLSSRGNYCGAVRP